MNSLLCGRCGNEATETMTSIPLHGGIPYCKRCIIDVQLIHARERSEAIPDLEKRLADLGGALPLEEEICGYITWSSSDVEELGKLCILPRNHHGEHNPKGEGWGYEIQQERIINENKNL